MRQLIKDLRGWRAGSSVDRKIAALALGWRAVFHRGGTICNYYDDAGEPGVLSGIPPGETCVEAVPAYSADHLWARRLAEQFDLEIGPGYTFNPLAVCITVLSIVGDDINCPYFRDLSEMMNTHILTTADADAWNSYLSRLPGADIYHTPEYHAAHEANGDGTAHCFVAEGGDYVLLHPFMLRDIPGTNWRDIESVYGYSGPLSNIPKGGWPIYLWELSAWTAFSDWCRHNRVIAEFTRFNPLSRNQELFMAKCVKGQDRETVVLDLAGTPSDLWRRYTKRHRGSIRRAEKEGLVCWQLCTGREIPPAFLDLYDRTMARRDANAYYSFSPAYFEALRHGLGDNLLLFGVQAGANLSAAALFLRYGDRLHYHLAASNPNSPGYGDNNLVLHTAARWGQANGCRWLHLGGGRTPNPGDSLLHFKASISSERRVFYTGRRVHNQAAYDQLCEGWMARHQETATRRPDYFLLWRKP